MKADKIHRKLTISGRVQGVFYRASTVDKALELGVTGYVRNEPDGSVYAEVEGTEKQVEAMVDWCKEGPRFANVVDVSIEEGELQGFESFKIDRPGGW